jgi:Tfp pilus assembly protein PilV
MHRRRPPRQRGVTLVEALLAFLALSLGLLGIARVHAEMRAHADLARQRGEAMRIAQARMETLRGFVVLGESATSRAYADIAAHAPASVPGTTTLYVVERRVETIADGLASSVTVVVRWRGRGGEPQRATLSSIVARSEPALEAAAPAPSPEAPPR